MALSDFLFNVRVAAMFLEPRVDFDHLRPAVPFPKNAADKAEIWLTPRTVEGFEEEDFAFLPPAERRQLGRDVRQFREVAASVAAGGPTRDQVRRAVPPFLAILRAVRPCLDPDWLRVYDAIRWLNYPPEVVAVYPDTRFGEFGDPVIHVYVTVADDAVAGQDLAGLIRRLEGVIEPAVREAGVTAPVYVGLWARSELPEVIGVHEE